MTPKKPTSRKPTAKGKTQVRGGTPRPGKSPAKAKASAKKAPAKRPAAKKPAAKRPVGRPTDYTPALADRICELISADDTSLREICARPGMPHRNTVTRWLGEHEDFAAKYAHAREVQGEVLFDGMRAIERKVLARKLAPNAARVVLNNQQWRAAKLAPKKYGLGGIAGEGEGLALVLVRDLTGRKEEAGA